MDSIAKDVPNLPSLPGQHGLVLHAQGQGLVTVAIRRGPCDRWHEWRFPLVELPDRLRSFERAEDVYIAQNRFWGRRLIARLAQLDALFADLDYYTVPDLAGAHPDYVLDLALEALLIARIPSPSLAVSTGRGLALVWLHSAIPRAALSRWNACQRRLWETLKPLGADRRALDAARVLRLIGTTHGLTKARVRALTPVAPAWPFDRLADEVLPLERAELYDLRVQRALRKPQERRSVPPQGFTPATLWEGRLSELQRLREHRWFGTLPPGQRDSWLFLAGVAMSYLAIPTVLSRELPALAQEIAGWNERESRSRFSAIFRRAYMAARGETVEWDGMRVDPRYRFYDDTIVERLEISEAEMRLLGFKHLVTPEIAREQEAARKRAERHAKGENRQTRAEFLESAEQRRAEARLLRAKGLAWIEVGQLMGISADAARKLASR